MILKGSSSEKTKKLLIIFSTLIVFLLIFFHIVFNLSKEVEPGNIGRVASVLGFVNGFITLVITQLLRRKIYVRWGSLCIASMLLLWFGIVFCLLELITPTDIPLWDVEIKNILLKTGILIWFGGLSLLLFLISRVLSIDIITLKKPTAEEGRPYFEPFQSLEEDKKYIDKFGVPCIDVVFDRAHSKGKQIYFPILLITDKTLHPWRLARRFSLAGLDKGDGVIFFTFSRPAHSIYERLKKDFNGEDFPKKHLIIVDCFSLLTDKQKAKIDCKVFRANPRNPYELNNIYYKSIKFLKKKEYKTLREKLENLRENLFKKKGHKKLRVVYDSITDFLFYTHMELAVPYLRHNIVWEEQNNVSSLYLVWPNIAEKPIDDEYLRWFMNTLVVMKKEKNFITMEIEDLFFARVVKYKVNDKFEIIGGFFE